MAYFIAAYITKQRFTVLTKNGGGGHKRRLSRVHYICTMHCVQCTLEKQCTAHHVIILYTDLVWPMGATLPKRALVNIWDHLIWPMATIAKFDEIVKIGGCIQLIKTVRVGRRAGGCQTCGTHISVTAWRIFSIRSSVELSRPVGVHCHGHRHCETYLSLDIGW